MSGVRVISTTSRRELHQVSCFLQGKTPKEIHAILAETLACFLPGRAKDLSVPLYLQFLSFLQFSIPGSVSEIQCLYEMCYFLKHISVK